MLGLRFAAPWQTVASGFCETLTIVSTQHTRLIAENEREKGKEERERHPQTHENDEIHPNFPQTTPQIIRLCPERRAELPHATHGTQPQKVNPMSKTTAPLLSFDARGQIGNAMVYSSWKGRPYVRRYVVPANPNTTAQQATRGVFAGLNDLYRYLPAGAIDAWTLYADNSRITSRNGWIKINLPLLRGDSDLTDLIMSPSAGGGVPVGGITVTPADDAFTVALTAPELPTGWTVASAHMLAIENIDPTSGATPDVAYDVDATDPYSVSLSGLLDATEYLVGGWFSYTKPNGETAYGVSSQELQTTL